MASRLFVTAAASARSSLARRITGSRIHGFEGRCWYSDKVNLWEDPRNPKRWKLSHFVAATWTVWGVMVYGLFKIFPEEMFRTRNHGTLSHVSAVRSKKE